MSCSPYEKLLVQGHHQVPNKETTLNEFDFEEQFKIKNLSFI